MNDYSFVHKTVCVQIIYPTSVRSFSIQVLNKLIDRFGNQVRSLSVQPFNVYYTKNLVPTSYENLMLAIVGACLTISHSIVNELDSLTPFAIFAVNLRSLVWFIAHIISCSKQLSNAKHREENFSDKFQQNKTTTKQGLEARRSNIQSMMPAVLRKLACKPKIVITKINAL